MACENKNVTSPGLG